jgi:hypothetical protein
MQSLGCHLPNRVWLRSDWMLWYLGAGASITHLFWGCARLWAAGFTQNKLCVSKTPSLSSSSNEIRIFCLILWPIRALPSQELIEKRCWPRFPYPRAIQSFLFLVRVLSVWQPRRAWRFSEIWGRGADKRGHLIASWYWPCLHPFSIYSLMLNWITASDSLQGPAASH